MTSSGQEKNFFLLKWVVKKIETGRPEKQGNVECFVFLILPQKLMIRAAKIFHAFVQTKTFFLVSLTLLHIRNYTFSY